MQNNRQEALGRTGRAWGDSRAGRRIVKKKTGRTITQ